jgi:hypothetical protein
MCAACVAQGVAYGGGALAALQVMAARARHRRGGDQPAGDPPTDDHTDLPEDEPAPA